jgi:hypothetical protein
MTQENPVSTPQSVSKAQDFKKASQEHSQPKSFTLPVTGLTVMVKRPSIKQLLAQGHVPDKIAQRIINLPPDAQGKTSVSKKDLPDFIELQKVVVKHAMVSPEVVDEPDYDNNQIAITDLVDDDVDAIFDYVTQGVRPKVVDTFRGDKSGVSS